MKTFFSFTSATLLLLTTLGAGQAMAFSENETNGTPAKAQLADPDDALPVPTLNLNGSSKDGSQDAASVRYDYDPENGTSVPHSPANDK